jgi:phage tail protein X
MSEHYEHITTAGERWDTIAYDYYGDPTAYEGIVAANPSVPIVPLLPSGIALRIPVVEDTGTIAAEELPPWKQ